MKSHAICLALLLMSFEIQVNAQERKMKIYISADMEGVVGVVTNEQLGPQGFEYARFREFMTQEVNAAWVHLKLEHRRRLSDSTATVRTCD